MKSCISCHSCLTVCCTFESANNQLRLQIQQRKESEQQIIKLQNELAFVGRILTVGQMAAGLAHELNQPLMAVAASADTAMIAARSNPLKSNLLYECLEDLQRDAQRAGEIIRTLRAFISKKTPAKSQVDLNKLISDSVRLVSADARGMNIEIIERPDDIPGIHANSVQLAQVLVNLLRNSADAILSPDANAGVNRITISSVCDSGNIVVEVSDTGCGISSNRELFVPFESKKSQGMGVGLSISREIIEAHGGELSYTSDGKTGTTFVLSLPASPAT